jgi:capsular exopolysaccharide synthesis family protein
MQITLKFSYRSKPRTAKEQRGFDSLVCGPSSWPGTFRPAMAGLPTVALCDDEERGIIAGVNNMSRFFDLPKQLPEPASNSSSASAGAATSEVETAFPLQQVPTVEVQVFPDSRIVMHTDPRSAGADRFRFLRMCLRELWNTGKLKSLLITSPLPQDGKSTVALNLATTLAEGGKRTVLLIEADLHHPSLTERLGLERRPGLAECLEAGLNPVAALRRIEPLGWYLLSAGETQNNPTDLLQTEALASVIQKLSTHFDWILIDSPPLTPLTDAISLARQANATLLVAREGCTPREAIEKAIALIGRHRVLGIVLNGMEGLERLYSGYYGYSRYSRNNRLKTIGPVEARKQAKYPILDVPKSSHG